MPCTMIYCGVGVFKVPMELSDKLITPNFTVLAEVHVG
jgi:hypothetical protein